MTPEQDKQLCEEFPLMYKKRHADMRTTCMCWGFEVNSGWFPIVYEASKKIEAILQKQRDTSQMCFCGCDKVEHPNNGPCTHVHEIPFLLSYGTRVWPLKSWYTNLRNQIRYRIVRTVNSIMFKLSRLGLHSHEPCTCNVFDPYHMTAEQVKEKLGGLRIYMSGHDDEIEKIISEAVDKSYKTCENCGVPGKCNEEGWLTTLCDPCRNTRWEKRKNEIGTDQGS